VAHKHSRLHRTTPLFLSPFLCFEVSVEMADLSVSADRSVCSGREWTHSLCHPHSRSTRSLSCGDFIREGNIHIRPNYSFSFPAGLYSTSLGPRDTLQSPYTPGQNAGATPLVYSPQTQPMNTQPQSRPVSACDSMSSFQIRLL